jgi:casein kinase 1
MDVPAYIVGGRWRLVSYLGEGSFGVVYAGVHIETGEEVAVKIEGMKVENAMLKFETACYKKLGLTERIVGFPRALWAGWCSDGRTLVMGRLGDDLDKCFTLCENRFSIGTVLQIADQAVRRLEYMHGCSMLHRDIKPGNFLLGLESNRAVIHLIDFGLAKRYRDERTHCHILYREGKRLTGTPRYASINSHLGIEQSRRDDLESLGYMLVYFLKGRLPWQGGRVMERKLTTSPAALCAGLPPEFVYYFEYCRELRFADKPDYKYLRALFWQIARRERLAYDGIFDWTESAEAPKDTVVDEEIVGIMEEAAAAIPIPPTSEPPLR